jgi:AAA ATPase domain
MELLERASVLDELDGVLAATATRGPRRPGAGEAGIGKSALVRRFTDRHLGDARFLLGARDPLLTPRALGPLHDLGRQTGGRLAALLAAGSSREGLFAALLDELDEGARPQVVVVEDAHWADEATLDLLVFLGRRMQGTRALLAVTHRDEGGHHAPHRPRERLPRHRRGPGGPVLRGPRPRAPLAGAEPHGDWMLDGDSVVVDSTGTVLAGPLVREEGILYDRPKPALVSLARARHSPSTT